MAYRIEESRQRSIPPAEPPRINLNLMFAAATVALLVGAASTVLGIPGFIVSVLLVALCLWLWAGCKSRRNPIVLACWMLVTTTFIVFPFLMQRPSDRGGRRDQCENNLRNIGLALLDYTKAHGELPPVCTLDTDGAPLQSWRTLLLPHLEFSNLFDTINLSKRWDDALNQKSTAVPVCFFYCPSNLLYYDETGAYTSYVAVIGPGTAWQPGHAVNLSEIKDNPHDTLLLVEMKDSGIKWAEPRDLDLDNLPRGITKENLLKRLSNHPGGFNALFADGHVEFIPDTIPWSQFEAMLTIAGGETIDRNSW
jgi:prepilin-type processing-associated H-X9-DG protein